MRLTVHNLPAHLKKPLQPIYLVAGDEPLQLGEALDLIRGAAKAQGYTEREVLEHDHHFDWQQLAAHADSMSLFGDRRLIELRLSSAKIGAEGSKALVAYLGRPPEDASLLIVSPKLDRSQTGSKWVKSIDASGALVQVWRIKAGELPGWLEQRMKSRGLIPEAGVADWLAEKVEGNLLAASQEIEKLLLLQGEGPISLEGMMAAASDSARYTVFDLADSALEGKAARCIRVLQVLRAEGATAPLVLWALIKEVRLLASLATEVGNGRPLQQALGARREIWANKRPLYGQAVKRLPPKGWRHLLSRCSVADAAAKGLEKTDPWLLMEDIALGIAGKKI